MVEAPRLLQTDRLYRKCAAIPSSPSFHHEALLEMPDRWLVLRSVERQQEISRGEGVLNLRNVMVRVSVVGSSEVGLDVVLGASKPCLQ